VQSVPNPTPSIPRRLARIVRRQLRWLVGSDRDVDRSLSAIGDLEARIASLNQRVDRLDRHRRVGTVMDFIASSTIDAGPLVSVIMPTRNRVDFLPRSIGSVLRQTYENWELIVADDGSEDGTRKYLRDSGARIRVVSSPGLGAAGARNRALATAQGSLICYLDDDNVMHPDWLKSVVWAFETFPQCDVLYGGICIDDIERVNNTGTGELPELFFEPYDHLAVARDNVADMGAIAHRAGLPEAQFDETLREMADWDLFLRLTRTKPPLSLPVLALYYRTDAPARLSNGPTFATDRERVREKNRR